MKIPIFTNGFNSTSKFLRCLSFLVLPVLASEASPRSRLKELRLPASAPATGAPSYLPVVGPPPLRFAQVPPPPDLSTRPPSAAPPLPAVAAEIAATNAASAKSAAPAPPGVTAAPPPCEASEGSRGTTPAAPKPPPAKEPDVLIPDDTKREIRPEEILPFFQFPGSGNTTTIVLPAVPSDAAPTRLPVSSAVYHQQ
jgi:hypothetical protein